MINFSETQILNVIAHKVENKNNGGKLFTSAEELELNEELIKHLTRHFVKPFSNREDFHHFHHAINLKMNEVFVCSDNIFEDENFIYNSVGIAKHLFDVTKHHAIKDGELFIVHLEGIVVDNKIVNAVGIYKSERKQTFFKVRHGRSQISLDVDHGIGQYRVDKACLILNTDYQDGFKVLTYEHNGQDADYWKSEFLAVLPANDSYGQTKQLLDLCRSFVIDEMEIPKVDQISLLNRSVEVLSECSTITVSDFTNSVFDDETIKHSFQKFQSNYSEAQSDLPDEIVVSKFAIKKQTKFIKSVIKLDSNFHIYVHGDRENIEQGIDENGRKYYKLYFDSES